MKRLIGMIVAIIGVASLVMGVIFIVQSNSGKKQIANDIAPLALSEVNARYDTVSALNAQFIAAEEPKIQAQQAQPSAMYNYLTAQRDGLGLAKANIGVVGFTMMNGVMDIILGVGMLLVGYVFVTKEKVKA
jgi:hypothetical protein